MKKFLLTLLTICTLSTLQAQTPQGLNYQGVARNASGVELANQSIGLELSILNGSANGTAVYTETHALTTDANGLFSLVIGNGTPATGTFASINWATGGSKWLKTSMDITGGTSYQLVGTTQLMSVPYALYAENVGDKGGKQTLYLTDDITDVEAAALIANEVGPNTQEVIITGTTNLTTVDLSSITSLVYLEVSGNSALTSLNLSGLTKCAGSIIITSSVLLTTLNLPALTKISSGEFRIEDMYLTTVDVPLLSRCGANMFINGNSYLTAISFPSLSSARNIDIEDNSAMTTLSMPSLASLNNLTVVHNVLLNAINFAGLVNSNNISIMDNFALLTLSMSSLNGGNFVKITGNYNLAILDLNSLFAVGYLTINSYQGNTLSFPTLQYGSDITITNNNLSSISFPVLSNGVVINLTSNQLSVACVNSLLHTLATFNPAVIGADFNFSGQSPAAAPTGQGIIDKATLISNGNSVTTD